MRLYMHMFVKVQHTCNKATPRGTHGTSYMTVHRVTCTLALQESRTKELINSTCRIECDALQLVATDSQWQLSARPRHVARHDNACAQSPLPGIL